MERRGLDHLLEVLDDVTALTGSMPVDSSDLRSRLAAIYHGLFTIDFSEFEVERVRLGAPVLLPRMQAAQLGLRGCIRDWALRGLMTRDVQGSLRDVFRISRYARDIVGEIGLGHPRLATGETTYPGFSGPAGYLEISPAFANQPFALQPGDVILQRGMVHNSAAIARIGDVDSQFSHVAMVAQGESGEPVMVEALIEDGAVVTPLDTALGHGLGRAILFRHQDANLAAWSSALIHHFVMRANGRTAPRVLYDFSMKPRGYDELFCAKLIRLAYSMGSSGEVILPTYATLLDMKNRDFIERIGVATIETFAPGDMELEPDFDVVAEWRDYRITSELRLKDMIMTKLFEWMEKDGYTFHPTLGIRVVAMLGRLSSHLPDWMQEVSRKAIAKVPPNMGARAIGAVAMLHETAEELHARLKRLEDDSIARTGHQLHPREVLETLESWRGEMGGRIGYLRG